ncbi:hypothetical protein C8R43DRAFT_952456 [Mycena crocata]|nr:hypothetical protein C8R43DRAFT_952456 [Mycena crocata]
MEEEHRERAGGSMHQYITGGWESSMRILITTEIENYELESDVRIKPFRWTKESFQKITVVRTAARSASNFDSNSCLAVPFSRSRCYGENSANRIRIQEILSLREMSRRPKSNRVVLGEINYYLLPGSPARGVDYLIIQRVGLVAYRLKDHSGAGSRSVWSRSVQDDKHRAMIVSPRRGDGETFQCIQLSDILTWMLSGLNGGAFVDGALRTPRWRDRMLGVEKHVIDGASRVTTTTGDLCNVLYGMVERGLSNISLAGACGWVVVGAYQLIWSAYQQVPSALAPGINAERDSLFFALPLFDQVPESNAHLGSGPFGDAVPLNADAARWPPAASGHGSPLARPPCPCTRLSICPGAKEDTLVNQNHAAYERAGPGWNLPVVDGPLSGLRHAWDFEVLR